MSRCKFPVPECLAASCVGFARHIHISCLRDRPILCHSRRMGLQHGRADRCSVRLRMNRNIGMKSRRNNIGDMIEENLSFS